MKRGPLLYSILLSLISGVIGFLIGFISGLPFSEYPFIIPAVFVGTFIPARIIFGFAYKNVIEIEELLKNSEVQIKGKSKDPVSRLNYLIKQYVDIKESEIENYKKLIHFRREFIANVSHELKTPLFAAQGFVHTLLDGAIKDKTVRKKFLKKAAKSLDNLELLVQDLLVLSQIESGEIKMNFEYFSLEKLILDILAQFENRAEDKQIVISFTSDAEIEDTSVFGDWQRIQQVLNNLLSNALNYTDEGGEVEIQISEEDDKLRVSVSDTGIGIPDEDLGRIFERFYRVDKSRSREKGGTGLGLAIVKHILDVHHTEISVKSKVGEGTVFSFLLSKEEYTY